MSEIVLTLLGGLVLFLYAVTSLSDVIRKVTSKKPKKWLLHFTKNTFTAILTGTIITILLDSSSVVIIITIVLVNSGLLTFRQAMGIVMGANIGTTISSQIIALDVAKYSPILLIIGMAVLLITSKEHIKRYGQLFIYFGMLFFGLFIMENAISPLKQDPVFHQWMQKMDNPITGSITGALVTLIIQSSSATVGMAILLVKKGAISLVGGIAIMLGAELGTCSDTLLATIRGNRQGIKTGLFHLIFNFTSIVICLLLFMPFVYFVEWMSGESTLEQMLANAHFLFNFLGVIVFVWFLPAFEKFLNKILPEKITHNHEMPSKLPELDE
ncbi:Na/Pi cotransporter family protein [Flavobacterium pedocola]